MKWRLFIRPRAENDLREAVAWYENQRANLGKEFLVEMRGTMQLLSRNPELQSEYYRGFRRILMKRFPYKVFYRMEGEQIIVFRILHAGRDDPRLV